MSARMAKIICYLATTLLLGCSSSSYETPNSLVKLVNMPLRFSQPVFVSDDYRYGEGAVKSFSEEGFIESQYEQLSLSGMDVVVNNKIDLCVYRKLLFVRITSNSTWLPSSIRNNVMNAFDGGNRFFQTVKTSEPVVYINAKPYPGTSINEDDVLWYAERDPTTFAWLKRFLKEDHYIIADAILNETNDDAGLLRSYAFEVKLIDSQAGETVVALLSRHDSLNKKPKAIIDTTIERINNWLYQVGRICDSRPKEEVEECVYEK